MEINQEEMEALRAEVAGLRKKLAITKITVTRSIKSPRGDVFVGFSSAFDTVQDDISGPGSDSELLVSDSEVKQSALTLDEARMSHLVLSLEVNLAAAKTAFAEGFLSQDEYNNQIKSIRRRHTMMMVTLKKEA
jgi:hypothetical protein